MRKRDVVAEHRPHAAFRSEAGEWFVYMSDMPMVVGELLFSQDDGRTFRVLAVAGFGGTVREHSITFADPHPDARGRVSLGSRRLELADGVVVCDGRRYEPRDPPAIDADAVIPLPRVRRCEYLFRFEDDGLLLHVGSDLYGCSYESFRLSIGTGASMRILPIRSIERYRDGGTTYIVTDEGVLYSPTPFREGDHARWLAELPADRHRRDATIPRGRILLPLDPGRFDVIDDPGRVSVVPRVDGGGS